MLDLTTLGGRVKHIRLALGVPLGGAVSRARFGELVGAYVPEQEGAPYHETTVKRWEEGAEPDLDVLRGISHVAQEYGLAYATPTWVAFGESPAPLATYTPAEEYLEDVKRPAKKVAGKKKGRR